MKSVFSCLLMVLLAACGKEGANGPAGPTGTKGDVGAAGVAGAKGSDGLTIASSFNCSKTSGSYFYSYQGVKYTSGDVWVSCEVAGSNIGTSHDNFFRSNQTGSTTYGCILTADVDAASGGFWSFSASSGKKAVYTDAASASNGTAVTFLSSDCVTY